jgi:RNA polymerase sigma-70 factor, ECF subfamily
MINLQAIDGADERVICDSELIKRALEHDDEAFRMLYERYKGKVYGLCLRFVDVPTAEDLTQEVFLVVFRKLHTFRGEARFSTWLYRVTANLVFMRRRKDAHQIREALSLDQECADDQMHCDYAVSSDRRLECTAERMQLQEVFSRLPNGYATVFSLHDVYGYQHDEIARMLNCSVGNTKSQLHKARLKLRRMLLENVSAVPHHHCSAGEMHARDREE